MIIFALVEDQEGAWSGRLQLESGLVARFQFAMPPQPRKVWRGGKGMPHGAVAEYEIMVAQLLGQSTTAGLGAKALDALNIGHVVIILTIVFGNVIYFLGRRARRVQA